MIIKLPRSYHTYIKQTMAKFYEWTVVFSYSADREIGKIYMKSVAKCLQTNKLKFLLSFYFLGVLKFFRYLPWVFLEWFHKFFVSGYLSLCGVLLPAIKWHLMLLCSVYPWHEPNNTARKSGENTSGILLNTYSLRQRMFSQQQENLWFYTRCTVLIFYCLGVRNWHSYLGSQNIWASLVYGFLLINLRI